MSLQGAMTTTAFWKGVVYENWVPSKYQDKLGGRNPKTAIGGGNNSGGGSGPVEPTPGDVNKPGWGNGADSNGYGGLVAGTTGNQNFTNASVGLTQVSSSTSIAPPMENSQVVKPGEFIQGKSGTPAFTPINNSAAKISNQIVNDNSGAVVKTGSYSAGILQ
jgi:hypothetical protein